MAPLKESILLTKVLQTLLEDGVIIESKISKNLAHSSLWKQLIASNILEKTSQGRGFSYRIKNKEQLLNYIEYHFPSFSSIESYTREDNIRKYRNSKAKKTDSKRVVFLRGEESIILNNELLELSAYTNKFELFASKLDKLECDCLCYVENLECFLRAKEVIGEGYIFLHPYGKVSKDTLKNIDAKKLLVWGDYDITGLNDYAMIKSVHPNATFFIPKNFEELFEKYSKKTDKHQKISNNLKNHLHKEPDIANILNMIHTAGRSLEQESLL